MCQAAAAQDSHLSCTAAGSTHSNLQLQSTATLTAAFLMQLMQPRKQHCCCQC